MVLRQLKQAFMEGFRGDRPREDRAVSPAGASLEERLAFIRDMSGPQFEHFMADVMRGRGYQVRVLGGSGDQGVDVIAQRGGERIAIQCKLYHRPVGNKPIQEVFAGARHHHCSKAIVVAPAGFTRGAETLARSTGVKLYDEAAIRLEILKIGSAQGEPANVWQHSTGTTMKLTMELPAPGGAAPRSIDTAEDLALAEGKGMKRHTVRVGRTSPGTIVGEEVTFTAHCLGTVPFNNNPRSTYTFYRLPDRTFRVLAKRGTMTMLVPSDMSEAIERGRPSGWSYGRMTLEEMMAHSFDFGTAYKYLAKNNPYFDWGL